MQQTPAKADMLPDAEKPSFPQRCLTFLRGRFFGFGLVGIFIMLIGIVVLYALVHYCGFNKNLAYFIQAVVSIELNFICNKFFNWRDRQGHVLFQWVRFHTTKIGTVLLNQLLFAFLVAQGMHYLLATLIGVVLATIINYIVNDKFVFAARKVAVHANRSA
jgi:putative flippase GtrA